MSVGRGAQVEVAEGAGRETEVDYYLLRQELSAALAGAPSGGGGAWGGAVGVEARAEAEAEARMVFALLDVDGGGSINKAPPEV